jgi:hypothetical protein
MMKARLACFLFLAGSVGAGCTKKNPALGNPDASVDAP